MQITDALKNNTHDQNEQIIPSMRGVSQLGKIVRFRDHIRVNQRNEVIGMEKLCNEKIKKEIKKRTTRTCNRTKMRMVGK